MIKNSIAINLVFEDVLQEAVMLRILGEFRYKFTPGTLTNACGFGKIKRDINRYNKASRNMPYFILTDLDRIQCPVKLITSWFTAPRHNNLLFRIAIPEVESWLIADVDGFKSFFKTDYHLETNADDIIDGKQFLKNIINRSSNNRIKQDILPNRESSAKIGVGYNKRLCDFVESKWNPKTASINSPSLNRALLAVDNYQPIFN